MLRTLLPFIPLGVLTTAQVFQPIIPLGTVLHAVAILGCLVFIAWRMSVRFDRVDKKQDALLSELRAEQKGRP